MYIKHRNKVNESLLTTEEKEARDKKREYNKEYYFANKKRLIRCNIINSKRRRIYKKITRQQKLQFNLKLADGKTLTLYLLKYLLLELKIIRQTYLKWEKEGIMPLALFRRQTKNRDRLYTKEQIIIIKHLASKYLLGTIRCNKLGFQMEIFPIWKKLEEKYQSGDYSNCE